ERVDRGRRDADELYAELRGVPVQEPVAAGAVDRLACEDTGRERAPRAADAAPRTLALPRDMYSARHHESVAAAAARCVTTNAEVASPPDVSALPPLKPNHPNQSMPAPSTVSVRLFGRIGSFG